MTPAGEISTRTFAWVILITLLVAAGLAIVLLDVAIHDARLQQRRDAAKDPWKNREMLRVVEEPSRPPRRHE